MKKERDQKEKACKKVKKTKSRIAKNGEGLCAVSLKGRLSSISIGLAQYLSTPEF